jgi:hypothetical protein
MQAATATTHARNRTVSTIMTSDTSDAPHDRGEHHNDRRKPDREKDVPDHDGTHGHQQAGSIVRFRVHAARHFLRGVLDSPKTLKSRRRNGSDFDAVATAD